MAWIGYKKTYDIVPHTWILECLKMYKISNKIVNFIEKAMENWRVQLKPGKQSLAEVKIQRGIFQEVITTNVYYSNDATQSYT